MSELTIIIDCWGHKELKQYLMGLNGVIDVNIKDEKQLEIYIKYNPDLINLKILKYEILLFLDILKIPSLIAFNKHFKEKMIKDTIIINDLCCEYCLKSFIEELLEIEAIKSAYTDFNYIDKYNVNIFISYDDKLLKQNELNSIKNKFNNY